MEVQVLGIRNTQTGKTIAHVRAGNLFGDLPCDPDVVVDKTAKLVIKLHVFDGRLQANCRVETLK